MDSEASELLTVIIPFLNEGEEVKNTLRSIREHGGWQVAVLLINDGSNGGYPYEEYAGEYGVSYFFNPERQGVARCWDMGVEMCRTPWFLLLDAHMWFYQEDWIQILVGELQKDEWVLLCCNTRILRKNEQGEMYDASGENKTFGARVHFGRDGDMLGAKWVAAGRKPGEEVEDIGCVLGAGYGGSKRYWQYLRGLEGGRCRLLKNLYIGHYYRPKAPYRIASSFVLYNKLLIAYLLLPLYMQVRVYVALQQEYTPKLFKAEFSHLMEKKEEWEALKKYYRQIFTRSFEEAVEVNRKQENRVQGNQVLLDKVFREVLLNCNRTDDLGIEKGRIGSILFWRLMFIKERIKQERN